MAEISVADLRVFETACMECPPITHIEVDEAMADMKVGRAAGYDGIPADVIRHIDCLKNVLVLLFSIMLRSSVYPAMWGLALIRSLLKPGKPCDQASSLRGI
eukprot:7517463-Karenia_brevis.AAC.1